MFSQENGRIIILPRRSIRPGLGTPMFTVDNASRYSRVRGFVRTVGLIVQGTGNLRLPNDDFHNGHFISKAGYKVTAFHQTKNISITY